ncbi:unnamed protein product [Pylaiella littoralis]
MRQLWERLWTSSCFLRGFAVITMGFRIYHGWTGTQRRLSENGCATFGKRGLSKPTETACGVPLVGLRPVLAPFEGCGFRMDCCERGSPCRRWWSPFSLQEILFATRRREVFVPL